VEYARRSSAVFYAHQTDGERATRRLGERGRRILRRLLAGGVDEKNGLMPYYPEEYPRRFCGPDRGADSPWE